MAWIRALALALGFASLAAPASGQTAESSATVGEIIWILRPAIARIPDGAIRLSLRVDLRCTVQSGRLARDARP